MELTVEMETSRYGGYRIQNYTVSVFHERGEVCVDFDNTAGRGEAVQRGGVIRITPDVARRLGHALLLISSGEQKDFPRLGVHFDVHESV